ncbi:unnamed protein product [Mytilus edulis]|uniref:Reverse transcriptase/retrotransposon-derived protein RNase H-like domain-containing protein n=1 Tax=Mytilus edulis TaxID=6550 RepID=A0A8S3QV40_MYTED|nr:unnamed protein product [Mytilus edulis]
MYVYMGTDQQLSFDSLKTFLTSTPNLAYPLPEQTFIFDTDASNTSIGAVLSQIHEEWENFEADVDDVLPIATRRIATVNPNDNTDSHCTWIEGYSRMQLQEEQLKDSVTKNLIELMKHGPPERNYIVKECAYRSTPHTSTGLTPNRLMLGREVHLPQELIFGMQEKSNGDYEDYVDRLSSSLQKCHEFARKSLKKSSEHQKRLHDLRKHEHTFETGDLVYAIDTAKKIGKAQSSKLNGKDLMWQSHEWVAVISDEYDDGFTDDEPDSLRKENLGLQDQTIISFDQTIEFGSENSIKDSKIQNAETEQKEIISLDSGTLSPVSSGSKKNVIVTKLTESLNGAIIPKISTKTDDSSDSSESRTQAPGSHVNYQMTKEEYPP